MVTYAKPQDLLVVIIQHDFKKHNLKWFVFFLICVLSASQFLTFLE